MVATSLYKLVKSDNLTLNITMKTLLILILVCISFNLPDTVVLLESDITYQTHIIPQPEEDMIG